MGYKEAECHCELCSSNLGDGEWVACESCYDALQGSLDAANERINELERQVEED